MYNCTNTFCYKKTITSLHQNPEQLHENSRMDKISIETPSTLEIDVADLSRIGQHTAGDLFRRIKTELVGQIFYSKHDTFRKVPLRLLGEVISLCKLVTRGT